MRLTAASLREAHLLDSFIREVMRLKGDTISTMRYTTCDAPLGEYVIPKGAHGKRPSPSAGLGWRGND